MGCGGSSYPVPPTEGPQKFKLKPETFGSDVYVNTEDDQKWMFLDNKSGWFAKDAVFELQTYETSEEPMRVLGKCVIEDAGEEIKREDEWEADSDASDFSYDDLFDGDDDVEHKVKLKWKIARTAKFYDADGTEYCSMKFKVKGKSKCEATYDAETGEKTGVESQTKVKNAFHHIHWPGQDEEIALEYEHGHWDDWTRTFKCPMVEAHYEPKWGRDEVSVDTPEGIPPLHGLLLGFAISQYFHPSRYAGEMDGRARMLA